MVVALLGSILLLAITLSGKCTGSSLRTLAFIVLGALGGWLALINVILPLAPSFAEETVRRVAFSGAAKLSRKDLGEYVFLVEGSSLTTRGLDGAEVEQKLRSAGISASVVQVSVAGANHVARLELFRQMMARVSPSQIAALDARKVIFCHEISAAYDRDPLSNTDDYAFTSHTLSYLTPQNFPAIVGWMLSRFNLKTLRKKKVRLFGLVFQHEIFNLFRINYLNRLSKSGPTHPLNGYLPGTGRDPQFHPDHHLGIPTESKPGWNQDYADMQNWISRRDRAYHGVLRGIVKRDLGFTLPIWWDYDYFYDRWYGQHGNRLFFSGNQPEIRSALGDPALWTDASHLLPAGAAIYSAYFADFLADKIKTGAL